MPVPPPVSRKTRSKTVHAPLWAGPEGRGTNGGVTQGLIGNFLTCRERFRLKAVEGWRANDHFSHRLEYGTIWHLMEEAHARHAQGEGTPDNDFSSALAVANEAAQSYAGRLCRRYPTEQAEVVKWLNVAKVQFPLYLAHWAARLEPERVTHLEQEGLFDVPYTLPSSRVVRLRGKRDGVDLLGNGATSRVYLFETKTKADVNETRLKRQLTWDLQTMLYLTAMTVQQQAGGTTWPAPVAGVRYNVVRRPLSGGKGSIVQHKPRGSKPGETTAQFYARLAGVIAEDPGSYFMRWRVEVGAHDVAAFRKHTLDPVLEQMCHWYEVNVSGHANEPLPGWASHWRHPYGVDNMIDEGYDSDVESYLETGSPAGLTRTTVLFPELQEDLP